MTLQRRRRDDSEESAAVKIGARREAPADGGIAEWRGGARAARKSDSQKMKIRSALARLFARDSQTHILDSAEIETRRRR